ncbi:asparagine synthetase B family protein [Aurantiacibacter marinus]|uniref:asparagine synthetase B family protein n=1 Tax=Aurantiacibacter marinus TaxID=874156 RepID=UPI001E36821D|nr:asparagine synthase-related protein [Aurantiacibacter marinus]
MAQNTDGTEALAAPHVCPDKRFTLVFDGYLLNTPELRADLSSHNQVCRDMSDAEVVLQGFRKWGEALFPKLEGEFSFVIWDAAKRRIICARDHFGMRPLTFHWDGRVLLVASDIAAIVAALDRKPEVNTGYLAEHLANEWYTQDETAWQGVMKLAPAHQLSLEIGDTKPRVRQYWQLPTEVSILYAREEEYFEHYREMLDDLVCRTSRTNRALAIEVSGGLDSSAIFCLADRAIKNGRLPAHSLHGFTLAGIEDDISDERQYSGAVAEHTGRVLAAAELFQPGLDWFLDQSASDATPPFPPNAVMNTGIHRAIRDANCRVALTGHGGDHWLNGGNNQLLEALSLHHWSAGLRSIAADRRDFGFSYAARKGVRQTAAWLLPESVKTAVKRITARDPDGPMADDLEANYWLSPSAQEDLAHRKDAYDRRLSNSSPSARQKIARWLDPYTVLAMEMVNLQSARHGFEYRHPMLSRRFMEFSTTTPEYLRRRGKLRKYIHREALKGILPETVRLRRDKAFFDTTFYDLHRATRLVCEKEMTMPPLSGLVSQNRVASLFNRHGKTDIDSGAIWELWGAFASATFALQSRDH